MSSKSSDVKIELAIVPIIGVVAGKVSQVSKEFEVSQGSKSEINDVKKGRSKAI